MAGKQLSPVVEMCIVLCLINSFSINDVIFRNRDEFSECYVIQLSSRVSVLPIDVRDNIRSWELSGEISKLEVRLSVENVVEKVAEFLSGFVLSVRVEDSILSVGDS